MTVAIVREISAAAKALGLPAMLIGATARIMLVENVFGLPTGRATRDVDVAFAMESWDQYEALRERLISQHGFAASRHNQHSIMYGAHGDKPGIPVDLVPFGSLSGAQEEIRWPPDMTVVMNMAGFADAFTSAVWIKIAPDLSVSVATLPSIAVLKVFAWQDRGSETQKDAIDLTALMRLYHEIDPDRVYSEPAVLEAAGFDIELAGAWLLGQDARQLTQAPTIEKLCALLADPAAIDRLSTAMTRALTMMRDPAAHANALLAAFTRGVAFTRI